jgi:hypothetical protein
MRGTIFSATFIALLLLGMLPLFFGGHAGSRSFVGTNCFQVNGSLKTDQSSPWQPYYCNSSMVDSDLPHQEEPTEFKVQPSFVLSEPIGFISSLVRKVSETSSTFGRDSKTAPMFHVASFQRIPNAADPSLYYDEQLGLTLTQDFTSLAYNVTAVEQTYDYGYGPAYLLNGLSDQGYWYQVGLSWNWAGPHASFGYTPGFNAAYEVFGPDGTPVFPSGGGVLLRSIAANEGDIVLLTLYFSSDNVMMSTHDWNTGSTALESYSAYGSTHFVGLPYAPINSQGFFTGLMTEQYHASPYYGNMQRVVYSNRYFALPSAWMWIDEFNVLNYQGLFFDKTTSPVSYSNPAQLQGFSSHDATEYSNAYQFITGSLNAIALTLSYTVQGGASGLSAPALSYLFDGVSQEATLTTSPTTFYVDNESAWGVTSLLIGSSSSERWLTNQQTTGNATSSQTINFVYYHQFFISFTYTIEGGGGGYSSPIFTYNQFGSVASNNTSSSVWVDSGSTYAYVNPLAISSSTERWYAPLSSGVILSSRTVDMTYYHQYLLTASYSIVGGGAPVPPALSYTSFASRRSDTLLTTVSNVWIDTGSSFDLPNSLNGSSLTERWQTNSSVTEAVSASASISLVYYHQYYVKVEPNVQIAGSVSPASGWYDVGTSVTISLSANLGWQFEAWIGSGENPYSGQDNSTSVIVNGPITETATFYPGLTIASTIGGSIFNASDPTSQVLPEGGSRTVYVPPGSSVSLLAKPSSFLYVFSEWSGAVSEKTNQISIVVDSPTSLQASYSYNYVNIGLIGSVIIGGIIATTITIMKRKRSS